MRLYTKNGRPLQVSGDRVYSRSGKIVGHVKRDGIYGRMAVASVRWWAIDFP